MSLLLRVNLALLVVFTVGATIAGLLCRTLLQRNAEHEIRAEAELMIDSALAARDYTATEVAVHRRVRVLPFRVENVMPSRSLEYFLSSQHWLDAFPPPMEPHYARLTAYVKTLLASGSRLPEPTPEAEPARQRSQGAEGLPDPSALLRLESELARFIGPVARPLVNRAVLRSSGVEELLSRLGREIESDAERRAFMDAARQSLRA